LGKTQRELTRLRNKVKEAKILLDIRSSVISLEEDVKRSPRSRKIRKMADEFLAELENGK